MKSLLLLVVLLALPLTASAQTTACQSWKPSNWVVGTSAVTFANTAGALTPGTSGVGRINSLGQLVSRRYASVCVSKHTSQAASTVVTIRTDGTAPTTAITDKGVVMVAGDCFRFEVNDTTLIKAIATVASTYLIVNECGTTP